MHEFIHKKRRKPSQLSQLVYMNILTYWHILLHRSQSVWETKLINKYYILHMEMNEWMKPHLPPYCHMYDHCCKCQDTLHCPFLYWRQNEQCNILYFYQLNCVTLNDKNIFFVFWQKLKTFCLWHAGAQHLSLPFCCSHQTLLHLHSSSCWNNINNILKNNHIKFHFITKGNHEKGISRLFEC